MTAEERNRLGNAKKRMSYVGDADAYRDLIESAPILDSDIPEVESAGSTQEQLRLYKEAREQMLRDELP